MNKSISIVAVLLTACGAAAQTYSFNFEAPAYTGSAAGTLLSAGGTGTPPVYGQNGWYMPVAGSSEYSVYTYAGNALGFAANPSGGGQFAGGRTVGVAIGRAQHAVCFGQGGAWRVTYDTAALYGGTLPTTDNLGSFSLQPSTTARYFQTLMSWGFTAVGPVPNATNYTASATRFHHAIGYFTTATPTAIAFATPSPAFRDLLVNTWYRVSVEWDFNEARILECSIQELPGGAVTTVDVTANNWFLFGGQNSTNPLPTDLRLFAGGAAGNTMAFDNVVVEPIGNQCYADCNLDGSLTVADFGCFQTNFVAGGTYSDCNCDGAKTVADFGCFQTRFVSGCP